MRVEPMPGGKWLRVDGVERRHRDRPVVERGPQCILIDERAASNIDEMRAGRHLRERVRVDEMTRTRGRGRGKDDVCRTREELVERTHDPDAFDGARRIGAAECAYFHAERL